MAVTDRLLILL